LVKSRYNDRIIAKSNYSIYLRRTTVGVDIYRGLQNQNTLRRANLSIVASKYQLLKMQEDIALNVANAFYKFYSIRKTKSKSSVRYR
jgi:hypothetical protein